MLNSILPLKILAWCHCAQKSHRIFNPVLHKYRKYWNYRKAGFISPKPRPLRKPKKSEGFSTLSYTVFLFFCFESKLLLRSAQCTEPGLTVSIRIEPWNFCTKMGLKISWHCPFNASSWETRKRWGPLGIWRLHVQKGGKRDRYYTQNNSCSISFSSTIHVLSRKFGFLFVYRIVLCNTIYI